MESITGIGPPGASTITVSLDDSTDFQNVRHFVAYPGLIAITKHGDGYLRGSLIHGARSAVYHVMNLQKNGMVPFRDGLKDPLQRLC
ncbi:IS110 family transposase [Salmonella enterica]|nr:IS110 family transposase [Salmonella enterica]